MRGFTQSVTATRAVLVDGSGGGAENPVLVTVKAATSTIYLGGPDVDASTHGYPLASTEAPLHLALVSEVLYAVTASGTVVADVLVTNG